MWWKFPWKTCFLQILTTFIKKYGNLWQIIPFYIFWGLNFAKLWNFSQPSIHQRKITCPNVLKNFNSSDFFGDNFFFFSNILFCFFVFSSAKSTNLAKFLDSKTNNQQITQIWYQDSESSPDLVFSLCLHSIPQSGLEASAPLLGRGK